MFQIFLFLPILMLVVIFFIWLCCSFSYLFFISFSSFNFLFILFFPVILLFLLSFFSLLHVFCSYRSFSHILLTLLLSQFFLEIFPRVLFCLLLFLALVLKAFPSISTSYPLVLLFITITSLYDKGTMEISSSLTSIQVTLGYLYKARYWDWFVGCDISPCHVFV